MTSLLISLLACGLVIPQVTGNADLAKMRQSFGEAPVDSQQSEMHNERDYSYHGMMIDYPTEIYFPTGKWNERFYINRLDLPSENNEHSEGVFVLQYETFKRGKVILEWSVRLESRVFPPVEIHDAESSVGGTMQKMLAKRGLALREPISRQIADRLSLHEGYAGYWARTPVSDSVWYWYCSENGDIGKIQKYARSVQQLDGPFATLIPLTLRFPISDGEAKAIKTTHKLLGHAKHVDNRLHLREQIQ